ncbi:MAG: DUF1850 domain-containing protein [Bacilli bacterium]
MNKYYKLVMAIITLLLIIIIAWPIFPILTIESNVTHDVLWSKRVNEGDLFTIRYRHSVARTDVDEVIRVGDGELIIDSSIYESFGAGLPSEVYGEQVIKMENGKVVLSNINTPMTQIDLFIGQVVANHQLLFDGESIPLKNLSKPGSSIRFSVKKESLLMSMNRGASHE